MRPLAVASAGAVLASCVVLALVSSRSSSSQLLQRRSAYDVIPVAQAVPLELVNPRARRHKGTPAQANAPRIPPKTETEKQAMMRARIEAKQDYLKTYNMAIQAENAAESQERKDRAARQKHAAQRHKFYGALKSRADKKEGWLKLQREMGMIMDGVDGLHYKGYSKH